MESYKYLSAIYDECMFDVEYGEWYGYLKRLLDNAGVSGEVLEAACGTGNLTRFLAKDYNVIAIDRSEEMLMIAQEKLRAAGLTAKTVCADMTDFKRENKCSAVVCAMDGVNYLVNGAQGFFETAYGNLKSGGVLLFDISTEHKLKNVIGDDFFYDDSDDMTYLWTNEYKNRRVKMDIAMFIRQPNGSYKRYDESHVQRAYSQKEITDMLLSAGFKDIRAYGFLTECLPKSDTLRIQFSAIKE